MSTRESAAFLLSYFYVTLKLVAWAGGLTVLLSALLVILRISPWPAVRVYVRLHVEVFRSIPLLALLLLLYFGVAPSLGHLDSFWVAVIALTLNESAYLAEVYRGAIRTIPAGQWQAAASLGFGWWRTVRHVIVPQAVRSSIPSTVNLLVVLVKDSSLASLIAVTELTMGASILTSNTFLPMQAYLVAAGFYFILLVPLSYLAKVLEVVVARKTGVSPERGASRAREFESATAAARG